MIFFPFTFLSSHPLRNGRWYTLSGLPSLCLLSGIVCHSKLLFLTSPTPPCRLYLMQHFWDAQLQVMPQWMTRVHWCLWHIFAYVLRKRPACLESQSLLQFWGYRHMVPLVTVMEKTGVCCSPVFLLFRPHILPLKAISIFCSMSPNCISCYTLFQGLVLFPKYNTLFI